MTVQRTLTFLTSLALTASLGTAALLAAQPPEPVSPGALGAVSRVTTSCPTFSWGSPTEADRHELAVFRVPAPAAAEGSAAEVTSSPEAELVASVEIPGSATSWTPPAELCLAPGKTFAWTIRSHTEKSTTAWADARAFTVEERETDELEQALERVLERFLEDRRIDEATAAALLADPSLLAEAAEDAATGGPTRNVHIDLEPNETALAAEAMGARPLMVGVYGKTDGKDGSAGVRGVATASVGAQTQGVLGITSGDLEDSAGVLGESKNTSSTDRKFGVLGISSDSNAESAGVAGRGNTGVLGVGLDALGVGIVGVTGDEDPATGEITLDIDLSAAGPNAKTGLFGGGEIGVQGVSDSATGKAGDFRNTAGTGLRVQGAGSSANPDLVLMTGFIDVAGANGVLDLSGDRIMAESFEGDGALLTNITAESTNKLGTFGPEAFLHSGDGTSPPTDAFEGTELTISSGSILNIAGQLSFDIAAPSTIFNASAADAFSLPVSPACLGCITGGGQGTGLDADKLDGRQLTDIFIQDDAVNNNDGVLIVGNTSPSGNKDQGSIITDGGLGVEENVSIGGKINLKQGEVISNETDKIVRLDQGVAGPYLDLALDATISLIADTSTVGGHAGQPLAISSGSASVGSGARGGDIDLTAGAGDGDGDAGTIRLGAGDGDANANGGHVVLSPGEAGSIGGASGAVIVEDANLILAAPVATDRSFDIVADEGVSLNGTLRYDPTVPAWQIQTAGGAFGNIATEGETASLFLLKGASDTYSNGTLTLANTSILSLLGTFDASALGGSLEIFKLPVGDARTSPFTPGPCDGCISGAGAGSGLDADFLDGSDSSAFLKLPLSGALTFAFGEYLDNPSNQVLTLGEDDTAAAPDIGRKLIELDLDVVEDFNDDTFDEVGIVLSGLGDPNPVSRPGTSLALKAEDGLVDGAGGALRLSAGAGKTSGEGGTALLQAGAADSIGNGGSVKVQAGPGGANSGVGGSVAIEAGRGSENGGNSGGDVTLNAGAGGALTSGPGGDVVLRGGQASGAAAGTRGGDIWIEPGDSSDSGDIVNPGSSDDGRVNVKGDINLAFDLLPPLGTGNDTFYNISGAGTVTAVEFVGDGSQLTGIGGGGLADDAVGTDELDDGSNTPVVGHFLIVDTPISQKQFNYQEIVAGAGISYMTNPQLTQGTLATSSSEAAFLADGGTTSLDCSTGGQGAGSVQVLDTGQLEYCDGNATPALRSGYLVPAAGTSGALLYSNGTIWTRLSAGTSSQVLVGGATPGWGDAPIADNSVTSAKIVDGTIETADLKDSSVTSAKIVDGTIATGDLADNSVDGNKLNLASNVDGDLMYYNGTNWVRLAAGTDEQFLKTNVAGPNISLVWDSLPSGGLANLVEDLTPQLGGQLDVNGNAIGDGTLELLKFSETASAVNELTIVNAATGSSPQIQASGDDTDVGIDLVAKGAGVVSISTVLRLTPTDVPGTCNGGNTGAVYWDTSVGELCDCNGTAWQTVRTDAACS